MDLKEVKEKVEWFIEKHKDYFEFVVDLDNIDNWKVGKDYILIYECIAVYYLEDFYQKIKPYINSDEYVWERVIIDNQEMVILN